MTALTILVISHDPVFRAEVVQRCVDTPYEVCLHSNAEDGTRALCDAAHAAVVVHVPTDSPPMEQILLAQLQGDATARQLPVVICSEQTAVLQSVMRGLQQRPGAVQACSRDVEELFVKFDALATTSGSSPV